MAEPPIHREPRQTATLRFARFIVRNRAPVAFLLIAISAFFFYPITKRKHEEIRRLIKERKEAEEAEI